MTESRSRLRDIVLAALVAVLLAACSMVQPTPTPLGTEQNPVKLALAPTTDTPRALAAGSRLTELLGRETGLHVKLSVPTSYAATIEAMGTHNLDVGWLSPLAYVLAHERVGAEAMTTDVHGGSTTSVGQIVVRADSGITSLDGLRGTQFAFADDRSLAGYHAVRALFLVDGLDPAALFSEMTFMDGDDRVALAVYRRQVAGGAIAGDIAAGSSGTTAGVRTVFRPPPPDLPEQLRVIARTDPVPNDLIAIRKGVAPEIDAQIREGLLRMAASPAGAAVLRELYGIDGLAPATDADFSAVRAMATLLDLNLDAELAPRRQSP
jgi:phosphonate transport system substrate-binding protein